MLVTQAENAERAIYGSGDTESVEFDAVDYLDIGMSNCASSRRRRAD